MRSKYILIGITLALCITSIATAANNTEPFSLGNAKVFWDSQDTEFHNRFILVSGLFSFAIAAVIFFAFGGAAASFSAQKSGHFADPEKKSGSATSMIAIIFVVLGLGLCLSVVLPIFGF